MAWAWAYLAVSLVGALLVANAFRPPRQRLLILLLALALLGRQTPGDQQTEQQNQEPTHDHLQ